MEEHPNLGHSPLRAVSSLRSHFESIVSHKPKPPTPPSKPSTLRPQPLTDPDDSLLVARRSFDIAHRPSPRASLDVGSEERATTRIPRHIGPPLSPPKKRPVPPQAPSTPRIPPPTVNITSPKSPQHGFDLPAPSPQAFAPQNTSSQATFRTKSPAPALPPPRHSRVPSRSGTPQVDGSRSPSTQPPSTRRPSATDQESQAPPIPPHSRKASLNIMPPPPPPINRSSKSRIPSRDGDLFSPNIAPNTTTNSPFSTPPASTMATLGNEYPPTPNASKPRLRATEPPAIENTDQRSPRSTNSVRRKEVPAPPQAPSSHHRQFSLSHGDGQSDTPEQRPDLPPRREQLHHIDNALSIRGATSSPLAFPEHPQRPSALLMGFSGGAPTPGPRQPSNPAAVRVGPLGDILPERQSSLRPSMEILRLPQPPLPSSYEERRPESAPRPSGEFIRPTQPSITNGILTASRTINEFEYTDSPAPFQSEYPDSTEVNRRPPWFEDGPRSIANGYETRLMDVCGEYICTTGSITRVWNLLTGKLLLSMSHGENIRVTALAFKPARQIEEEGSKIWLSTNIGELLEVDVASKRIVASNTDAHARKEVIRIHRNATEVWTLDTEGRLLVWPSDSLGSPDLSECVFVARVPRGHSASLVTNNQLWLATGKEINVYQPTANPDNSNFQLTPQPLSQSHVGDVASCTTIPGDPEHVYFGHADGKISCYSVKTLTCVGVVNVSVYKIGCLVGVGDHLWAGFSVGMVYVYDPRTQPWKIKKYWHAHQHPVATMVVDRSGIWKLDRLQVVSLAMDNSIGIWDGMLREDWLENEMQAQSAEYCTFQDMSALVVTWNAGACKPTDLKEHEFFQDLLQGADTPDLIAFGLQELVDLEDKKLTAKSFFKGRIKDAYGHEQLSSAYRSWRDHFTQCIENYLPVTDHYVLLHSASLVGLFSCIFVKTSHKLKVRDLEAKEIKLGLGGLHGNKGALVVRFTIDDSSLCFVNCHLAAGQGHTSHRNADVAAILEVPCLSHPGKIGTFVGGGDGSMIMDHEICIMNGDLNYRIDTMPRDTVIAAIRSNNLGKLLERDQLVMSRRKIPSFRLRAFTEAPITFAPTYKYDVGTDNYDSSDKKRVPAWCDRILFRGGNSIRQIDYRRHELRVSDHRPVSGSFILRVRTVEPELKHGCLQRCEEKFEQVKQRVSMDAKLDYLTNIFGLSAGEAQALLGQ